MSRNRFIAALAAAAVAALAIVGVAQAHIVTLTNSYCSETEGAYGHAYIISEEFYQEAGVGTVGTGHGCDYRVVDAARFEWSGGSSNHGPSGMQSYNVFYYDTTHWVTQASGTHRICAVPAICGSAKNTLSN
jgi:hypothetical protein